MVHHPVYFEEICIARGVTSGDAFFLDTNALIAFVDATHPYHLSTIVHVCYLIQQGAKLFISEVVVSEALNTLAKILYAKLTSSKTARTPTV